MQASPVLVSSDDLYLFNTGQLFRAYRTFGAHLAEREGQSGVRFVVWAPNAREVNVVGDFNGWNSDYRIVDLAQIGTTGVWAGFGPGLGEGARYKYEVASANGEKMLKSDPFGFQSELRPSTASIVTSLHHYEWHDQDWQSSGKSRAPYEKPMLIYEVHLASWRMDGPEQFRDYGRLADELVDYVCGLGYTHIELLPITEHPLDRSWGYQATGYYAATSRYGPPEGLQKLIDRCHGRGIGVLLDWVCGHFCKDDHGLRLFDGSPLYENADYRRAEKPLWGTLAFDFGKPQVLSFLLSNALFWLDVYHIDGLRVDAVASMIDMNFDKPDSMRTVNRYGGTEDIEALHFLRKLNETVFRYYPESLMMAEDSSSYPAVTSPTYVGGLGFNYKWNMGWMNDMLRYMETDPAHRSSRHSLITFSLHYAFSENYVLPLSHDEVVHGKRSMLNKMPGAYPEKFANLRLFYGYWMTHPGKKLLFMGGEFGQFDEWKDYAGLDWDLLRYPLHDSMLRYMERLNQTYRHYPALWESDHKPEGFEWIDVNNASQCMLTFQRNGNSSESSQPIVTVCNFSREAYSVYRIGVARPGCYNLVLNSDEADFGGSGSAMPSRVSSTDVPLHGKPYSIEVPVPALSIQLWQSETA
ncbi:1,4-alpha-glucan branching protein GlgB [Cohnella endophytica]|uniref:1,4-alpha-glucan branching enzyme GlgB n=1 Tax=Cohnella endophytica TaxID=2419778 RepID=A0A494Y964_9BACL|nr:1,4-alpha-glucan branching protein GlgB [Cohnella endophytica]RKP57223.1 1,4-alpha-glucan branching protein GlgB [Cohnella endophytica]